MFSSERGRVSVACALRLGVGEAKQWGTAHCPFSVPQTDMVLHSYAMENVQNK